MLSETGFFKMTDRRKSNVEMYITICKMDSQWEFAIWLRKHKQGLCINLDRWDGEGHGRGFQKGEDICVSMAEKKFEYK